MPLTLAEIFALTKVTHIFIDEIHEYHSWSLKREDEVAQQDTSRVLKKVKFLECVGDIRHLSQDLKDILLLWNSSPTNPTLLRLHHVLHKEFVLNSTSTHATCCAWGGVLTAICYCFSWVGWPSQLQGTFHLAKSWQPVKRTNFWQPMDSFLA